MHNGDCIGWDEAAGLLWKQLSGCIWLHPPTNPDKRAFLSADMTAEPLPYLERNHVIVNRSDIMVATPGQMEEQLRSGTWATIRYTRKQLKPLVIIWPDGTSITERTEL